MGKKKARTHFLKKPDSLKNRVSSLLKFTIMINSHNDWVSNDHQSNSKNKQDNKSS